MTEMLKGIAASDGVAVAKAYLLVQPDLSFETVTVADTNAEEARLDVALQAAQDELSVIRENAVESLGEEAAAVFDAHLMVLADPEMISQVKETIRAKQTNAETGLKEVTDMFITIFEGMEDNPYMQERAADIRDVAKRVLAHLLGVKLPNPATINEESIVIAHDLTPSDTAQLNKQFVKAFVTNIGGRTSHSAIMARTLEIAAVLGTNDITKRVKDGDVIAVNGITGEVIIDPSEDQVLAFKEAGAAYAKQKQSGLSLKMRILKQLMANTLNWLLISVHLKTLKVLMAMALKLLAFTVLSSCTWILKTSQLKTNNTKLTRQCLKA